MNLLGMFARYWEPGRAKTRLGAELGWGAASRFHRACVETSLARFGAVADRRLLAITPFSRVDEFRSAIRSVTSSGWSIVPQAEGDLGQRMRQFFEEAFAGGACRVVLVGSDTPTLPLSFLEQAFAALESYPVVLGPADDGGYYLLGASQAAPPIFEGIDWGTSQVWRQSTERLREAQIDYAVLPAWYDIDTLDDLCRLRDELASCASEDDFSLLRPEVAQANIAEALARRSQRSQ